MHSKDVILRKIVASRDFGEMRRLDSIERSHFLEVFWVPQFGQHTALQHENILRFTDGKKKPNQKKVNSFDFPMHPTFTTSCDHIWLDIRYLLPHTTSRREGKRSFGGGTAGRFTFFFKIRNLEILGTTHYTSTSCIQTRRPKVLILKGRLQPPKRCTTRLVTPGWTLRADRLVVQHTIGARSSN